MKTNIFELDGLFSLGTDFASFYVVLGIGATTFEPEIAGISTNTSTYLSGSAGIGGKIWLGRNFGLRAEGRWRWVSTGNTTDLGVWCDPFGVCYGYPSNVYGTRTSPEASRWGSSELSHMCSSGRPRVGLPSPQPSPAGRGGRLRVRATDSVSAGQGARL